MSYLLSIVYGYAVNVELIPRATERRCPKESTYREELGTCSCEEHCHWDSCRLTDPPTDCLLEIHSKWHWDYIEEAWVAQVTIGITIEMQIALIPR